MNNTKVLVSPGGVEFEAESDQTILAAALQNKIHLQHSCKNGECGVCEASLVSGEVAFDGNKISVGNFLTCKSVALSNVEIKAEYFPQLSQIIQKTVPVKVDTFERTVSDVVRLVLRSPPTNKLDYLAGQYVELTYQGVTRPYSIANAQNTEGKIELHIRKVETGKMSERLFAGVRENTLMRLRGPCGTFFLRESESPIIFLATGTGYAPIKAIVEELLAKNDSRPVYLYWGARYQADLYCELPKKWSNNYKNIHYIPVLSRLSEHWAGDVGYVQDVALAQHHNVNEYSMYACGSPLMIDDAKNKFIHSGLNLKNFYSDAFTAAKSE